MEFIKARDIQKKIKNIVAHLNLRYINSDQVICFRSFGSSSRATARIWSLPRIWQQALDLAPYYAIEILSEKFDSLKEEDKTKVLIHELLHIPKTFSGALRPHKTGTFTLNQRIINKLYREYRKNERD
ncbi:MAG: putative metallopeptidase [Candidatus Shapirobacteria bacterium]|nr:putative metallopeptidase [Candidatus Shapirobacteria bacterium]